MSTRVTKLCVLISGNGSNLQAIIDAVQAGRLNAQITGVISNRPNAYGLERAREAGIEAVCLDHIHVQEIGPPKTSGTKNKRNRNRNILDVHHC